MPETKNIDLVNSRVTLLQKQVDNCDPETLDTSLTIAKYLERALNNKEINEGDYKLYELGLGMSNIRFKRECLCRKKS